MEPILEQVLRGISLNREPGYHFAGNFLGISWDEVAPAGTTLSLDPGAHFAERDGQAAFGAMAMIADMALAGSIRPMHDRSTRLATIAMTLQLTGAPRTGRLSATAVFKGVLGEGPSRQGLSRVEIRNESGPVGFGSGTFLELIPPAGMTLHPVPHRKRGDPPGALLARSQLRRDEAAILRHAENTLSELESTDVPFIRRFWGCEPRHGKGSATCVMKNGAHVGNRVGHAQGGILMGLAASTAEAALPPSWSLVGISAWFVSPGEGASLRARAKVIHHGRQTAVVRTEVFTPEKRRVLEVVTAHCLTQHEGRKR